MTDPVITVADPPDDQNYWCPDDPVLVNAVCPAPVQADADFVRAEYTLISGPPAGNGAIAPSVFNFETLNYTGVFTGDANGSYVFQFQCVYSSGPPLEDFAGITRDGNLDCPAGVANGARFDVTAIGLEDYTDFAWTISGPAIFANGAAPYQQLLTATGLGPITINLVALRVDQLGNTTGAVDITCETVVYDPTLNFIDSETEIVPVQSIDFGEKFDVGEFAITLNCDTAEKIRTSVPVAVFERQPTVEIVNTGPIDLVPVVGNENKTTMPVALDSCDPCDDEFSIPEPLDQDRPVFIWNDCMACAGWEAQGDAVNATRCGAGSPWILPNGSGTFSISGPTACSADVALIYGHNFESVTVTGSAPVFDGQRTFGLCQDRACVGGFTRPLVINFADLTTSNSFDLFLNGTGIDGQPVAITQIIIGQKLFVPGDCLDAGFVNPLDGLDKVSKVKYSECGIVSIYQSHDPVNWTVTLDGPQTWVEDYWRSYLRYLGEGNPVVFQPSRNNAEQDVLVGRVVSAQQGTSYISCNFVRWTLTVNGYINQPQVKAYA